MPPDQIEAFQSGRSLNLIRQRNPNLGQLLLTERSGYYIQILYRLVIFRENHELEPLFNDVWTAVAPVQHLAGAGVYSKDNFAQDIKQLEEWQLIDRRIEKEKIRGYSDNRNLKFRISLQEETLSFIKWLEYRLAEQTEAKTHDVRDLLEEVCGSLNELLRNLHAISAKNGSTAKVRRVMYQLYKLDDLTLEINRHLADYNGALHQFIANVYEISVVKELLQQLDTYVATFLSGMHMLQQDIVPALQRLNQKLYQNKIESCCQAMAEEQKKTPTLFRGAGDVNLRQAAEIPARLLTFYEPHGRLASLMGRINQTSLRVCCKIHAYLRELERKSHRLEDLKDRISEISQLASQQVPHGFLSKMIGSAQISFDPQYWNAHCLADPPLTQASEKNRKVKPPPFLKPKTQKSSAAQSIEEARLESLKEWIKEKVMTGNNRATGKSNLLSAVDFDQWNDLTSILQLAKAGLLNKGTKLDKIGFKVETTQQEVTIQVKDLLMQFKDMGITEPG